jgi:hypothetical protein
MNKPPIRTKNLFENKTIITAAFILLLAISTLASSIPLANAHTPPWNIPTYAYVTASPSTIGVNEYTLIVMWLDKFPPTAGGLGGDRWQGFKVEITKPDGTKETLGPFISGQVGTTFAGYSPTQVGDYKLVFSWPGQTLTNGTGSPNLSGIPYVGDYFMPATSDPFILHVQQQPIQQWQEPPLPSYWSRPLNSANRNWANLATNWPKGSWFRYSNFQEQGQAPNSAHIVWATPLAYGGITDARYGAKSAGTMDYEFPWSWSSIIIMNGKIFLNNPQYPKYGYYALDLKTGEQLWYKNGTDNGLNNPATTVYYQGLGGAGVYSGQVFPQLSFGQLYSWHGVNGEGNVEYLWLTQSGTPQTATSGGTMWHMLDANNGNWIMSIKNVPGGTSITDQDGSLLLYSYSASNGRFTCWNSSQTIGPPSPTGTGQQQWKPRTGAVLDAVNDNTWTQWGPVTNNSLGQILPDDIRPRSGYTMNVTGPAGLPGLSRILQDSSYVPRTMLFSDFRNLPSFGSSDTFFLAAAVRIDYNVAPYSPQPDKTETQNNNLGYGVTLLWNKTIQKPLGGNLTFSLGPVSYEDKVFTIYSKETRQWWGYNLDDGTLLWGPTDRQSQWDVYGSGGFFAYGKLFSGGYGGVLYSYDVKTGRALWNYTLTQIGYESPYGNFQLSYGGVADGKIYIYSGEHSPTNPLWRGSYLRCINATTGQEIWKLLDYNMGIAIADGYLVTGSMYDTQLYCIGKGPSATTVSAPDITIALGTPVLIEGTVTDQSPGAKGTPAIADANQQAWMEYIYEQQAKPTNVKGVPVKLTAIDPNGNTQNIATTTSDINGGFAATWQPPVTGLYTVIATFEGTESYAPSIAETHFVVGAAAASPAPVTPAPTQTISPTASPPPTIFPSATPTQAPPPPPQEGIPTATYVAIAAAVVVVLVIAAAIALRKRS